MTSCPRIGILGGTLDPIHVGHIDTARAAATALALDRVLLMPARVPPHRASQPVASPYHRFAMTALAVNGIEGLEASDIDCAAAEPSFTADTLLRLHASGLAATQIFFITGADAFAEIETWSRYPQVLDLAHFIVISRPGYPADALPSRIPALAGRMIASPQTGAAFSRPSIFLVDAHTADVSSSEIRRRLMANQPVTGLIPAAVETHIRQHGLYVQTSGSGLLESTANHLHGQN